MYHLLKEHIRKIVSLPDEQLERVLQSFEPKSFDRNEFLSREGETCQSIYFMNSGCVRTFYIDESGDEATRYIAFGGAFISALASLITQTPSLEFVQALQPSEVLCIDRTDFRGLLETISGFEKVYIHNLERAYLINTWRLESFIKMNATERYDNLLKQNPTIVQQLPNKVVASYLGISQETLSRLKSKK